MPISGKVYGAAASDVLAGALTDLGINDAFRKEMISLATSLHPGNAALFALAGKMSVVNVFDAIKGTRGLVLKASLDRDNEQALRDVLAAIAKYMQAACLMHWRPRQNQFYASGN